ncbi:MAG TPA: ATP-binding protein [Kofleriaceae bacterium]|nr:ATP-binding protein [Kofleriaceae bacterium]
MRQPAHFRRARISLQTKLIAGLIVIVLAPLLVAAYFVGQLGDVTSNFARNEVRAMRGAVEHADQIYRQLIEARLVIESEVARRLADEPAIAHADPSIPLDPLLSRENALIGITVKASDEHVVASASRPRPEGPWVTHHIEQGLPGGGSLGLDFAEPDLQGTYYPELQEAMAKARQADDYRSAIPSGQKIAFLALLSGAVLIAIVIGVFASRRVTVRVAALLDATRSVSAGHLDARATLRGRDEMAELAVAFNTMLDDLESKRAQIEYLQRIGAWQDVARKLAHEIKNPLTPIQLAVQQTASSYKGDDARFKKQLQDTTEIVEEEIEGLRRLVDTFRTLGALPKVEAAPILLSDVLDDLLLDPQFTSTLKLHAPPSPVTIRADKLLLKRVLSNLAENGLHAARDAGAPQDVHITWSPSSDRVTIFIDDHGPGVPADSHDKIFEPYVTTKATGTGLGLAISKKIALEHDGDLTISPDRAPTGGARFILTLPLA